MAGAVPPLPNLAEATLILIDLQTEYREGPLALVGVEPAIARAATLLAAVRAAGGRVVHVAHAGRPGGAFDRAAPRGAVVAEVAPAAGEPLVEKRRVSAFVETDLARHLPAPGTAPLIVAGFMTHNCVSSTVREASDRGFAVTVVADACATRDLPAPDGGVIAAADLHRSSLVALSDRCARIVALADLLAAG
jgi:nicotinamidase-related amidase